MNNQFKKIFFVYKIVMALIYIAIGLTLLISPGAGVERFLPAQVAPVLGILLIAYGSFRGYQAYMAEKKQA